MNSLLHGEPISEVEVTNISGFGFWLLVRGKEMFLPYEDFPWFREQSVSAICHVVEPRIGVFHWPDLDIDLTEAMIEAPDRYPNVAIVRDLSPEKEPSES